MEPYWNMSRLEQVIGRGFRFCSHKDLPKENREIQVFIYVSVDPSNKKLTVDKLILDMAHQKNDLTKQFEQVIKDAAIDRYLFAS
jgi:hypothetical protein